MVQLAIEINLTVRSYRLQSCVRIREQMLEPEKRLRRAGIRPSDGSLTAVGRKQLLRETQNWGRMTGAIGAVLKAKEA